MALGVTVAEIDKILKLDYQGPIREMLVNKNVLLSTLKKDYSRDSFQGKKSVIPVHTGRNIGRGWRAEDAIIPFPGKQSHDNVSFHVAYLYGRIGITGQTIAQSRNDKGAFARALDLELKGLVTDMSRTLQKAVWSDGSGRLTDLRDKGSTTGVVGHNNVNTANQDSIQVNSDRWLEVGQPVFVARRNATAGTDSKRSILTATDGSVRIKAIHAQDAGTTTTAGDLTNGGYNVARAGYTVDLEPYNPVTGAALATKVFYNNAENTLGTGASIASKFSLYAHGSRGVPQFGGGIGTPPAADTASAAFATAGWTVPQEQWGLDALISDENPSGWAESHADARATGTTDALRGLLGEVDRTDATKSWWKSNIVDCADRAGDGTVSDDVLDVTLDAFQEAYDVSDIEGDFTPGVILTSYRIRRKYAALFSGTDFRRFGTEKEIATGWTGIQFNNSVILCDKDAHAVGDPRDLPGFKNVDGRTATWFQDAYFLSREAIKWIVMEDMSWEDTGGTIVREGVGANARDRYEAWMKAYWNLIIERPRSHTRLKNIKF